VALVAVLVGYPLSYGPALFFHALAGQPAWSMDVIEVAYFPIESVFREGPDSISLRGHRVPVIPHDAGIVNFELIATASALTS
jgi:hypothetical protein